RASLEGETQICGQISQVETTLRVPLQFAGLQREVQLLCRARTMEIQRSVQRSQARQRQNILQSSAGRVVQGQHRVHARLVEMQVQLVLPVAVDAARRDVELHVADRMQVRAAIRTQRSRSAGQFGAQ